MAKERHFSPGFGNNKLTEEKGGAPLKQFGLILLFAFFLITQGLFFLYGKDIGETRLSYERVIGVQPNEISKMNVGYRSHNGWEFTTRDKDLISLVFYFLKEKQYVQQDVIPTSGTGLNNPHYTIHLFVKDQNPHWIRLSIYGDDGKTIRVEGRYYKMINGSAEDGKEFFESLRRKWKLSQQSNK